MVCVRCKMAVKAELNKRDLHLSYLELGEAEIIEEISVTQLKLLDLSLREYGLELIDDSQTILVEKIKTAIIKQVHFNESRIKVNLSDHLSEMLNHNYKYLSNLFSKIHGTTIEQYYILHKIEKVKELLMYDELNLSEIAIKMHYSSVAHLSTQFKKMTGLTPTHYKSLKHKKRTMLGEF